MATRAAKKSQRKSPSRPLAGVAVDPSLRGRGPKKGAPNAGRPPNEHRAWCQRAVSDPKSESAVLAVLTDKAHPAFATMWKAVTDRAYGKAPQPLTGADGEGPVAVEVTRRIVRPAAS